MKRSTSLSYLSLAFLPLVALAPLGACGADESDLELGPTTAAVEGAFRGETFDNIQSAYYRVDAATGQKFIVISERPPSSSCDAIEGAEAGDGESPALELVILLCDLPGLGSDGIPWCRSPTTLMNRRGNSARTTWEEPIFHSSRKRRRAP